MSEKLKPCAHCGGEAKFERSVTEATIRCQECRIKVSVSLPMSMFVRMDEQEKAENSEAFEIWNRRHQDQSNQSEFERMLSK